MNRYILLFFFAIFSLRAMIEKCCGLPTCDGTDNVLVCMNDYFCCANTPCAYCCEKCLLQVIDKQRLAPTGRASVGLSSVALEGGSSPFYCPICAAPHHSQITNFYETLMVGLKRKFTNKTGTDLIIPFEKSASDAMATVSDRSCITPSCRRKSIDLICTNGFFHCKEYPCSYFCEKCLVKALNSQRLIRQPLTSHYPELHCPTCGAGQRRFADKVILSFINSVRERKKFPRRVSFGSDEVFVIPRMAKIDTANELLALSHTECWEGCIFCKYLTRMLLTPGEAIRRELVNYFKRVVADRRDEELWLYLASNPDMAASLLANYKFGVLEGLVHGDPNNVARLERICSQQLSMDKDIFELEHKDCDRECVCCKRLRLMLWAGRDEEVWQYLTAKPEVAQALVDIQNPSILHRLYNGKEENLTRLRSIWQC